MVMQARAIKEKIAQRKNVTQRFKNILIDKLTLSLEPEEINEDSPLFGLGLGLDSVDALELVVGVEQEFHIVVTDEDINAFRSVNTVVDFVIDRINSGGASHD